MTDHSRKRRAIVAAIDAGHDYQGSGVSVQNFEKVLEAYGFQIVPIAGWQPEPGTHWQTAAPTT